MFAFYLNFSFMKDIHVVGEKMPRKGRKTAIYLSQILGNTFYVQCPCPMTSV